MRSFPTSHEREVGLNGHVFVMTAGQNGFSFLSAGAGR